MKQPTFVLPNEVLDVVTQLKNNNFEAFIVGGCVRDILMHTQPKDWDITTNANPEQIQAIFTDSFYENTFGTVGIKTRSETPSLEVIEVTPYRTEGEYSDNRHPDTISFAQTIEEDLLRRDFTVNAIAYNPIEHVFIDPYKGQEDIKTKTLRAVGNPEQRFQEDALRILRLARFAAQLGFSVSYETLTSAHANGHLVKNISTERIRDEFIKTIQTKDPMLGLGLMQQFGVLELFIPELLEGIGCEQKGEHIYDVFQHLGHALGHAAEKDWPLHIRLAALFHDIGKPRTRRPGVKKAYTFYGHEVIGAKMTHKILERLKFPKKDTELITKLVRWHMFFSDTEQITLSAVRRMIQNVGVENIWDLMKVRECDRVGMKKKEAPYRLRKYHAMIEEALRAPTSVKMLKINGEVLTNKLNIEPGRRMGWILHALLEECLEDDSRNTEAILEARALELNKLSDIELKERGEAGKEKQEQTEEELLKEIRKKHGV